MTSTDRVDSIDQTSGIAATRVSGNDVNVTNAINSIDVAGTDRNKNNLRLGLILASVAIVFFAGFMAKMIFFGR